MRVLECGGRVWRTLASTLAFAIFGLIGVILSLVFFPLLSFAFWRSNSQKVRFARNIV